jgi:AraC-like DNA-binding protein
MERHFFEPKHLTALRPETWRIASFLFPAEVPTAEDSRLRRWCKANEDRHAHTEVLLALDGEGLYGLRDKLYLVKPGTLVLFDSFAPHQRDYPEFATVQDHLWFSVVPAHFTARILRIRPGTSSVQTSAVRVCHQEDAGVSLDPWAFGYGDIQGVSDQVRRTRILATVAGMVAAIQKTDTAPEDFESRRSFQARIMATIRDHIRDNAGNGASLDHLSRIAGYSKFHLHRLFREHYGETVQEFVDESRRRRVRQLLQQGAPKKQIADELGFSCPASFSRWLRLKGS